MHKLTGNKYRFSTWHRDKKLSQRTALIIFIISIMYVSEAMWPPGHIQGESSIQAGGGVRQKMTGVAAWESKFSEV